METARALILAALIWLAGLASCANPGEVLPGPAETGQTSLPPSPTIQPTKTSTPLEASLPPPASSTPTASALPTRTPRPTQTAPPTITPTPTEPACLRQGGSMNMHTLRTEISPLPWEFRVYTPPCYREQAERRYPLLILIHGSNNNDSQWDLIGADETADALIGSGELPPFIILMPRDRVWIEPDQDPFGTALVDHIIPWMDENYRTLPQRNYRAIGGLSRGASWAVHLGLSEWETFGSIGGHSLPVFVTDPPKIQRWLKEIPADSMPRIFLDIGENDRLRGYAQWFENLLTENGIPHEWYLFPGRHEDIYWQTHIERYLRWYAAEW